MTKKSILDVITHTVARYQVKYKHKQKLAMLKLLGLCLSRLIRKETYYDESKESWMDAWCVARRPLGIRRSPFFKLGKESKFFIPMLPKGSRVFFDITAALKINPMIDRIGLVFFMGVGDYFYATNFIERLKKEYPKLVFDAYVSKNTDGNNSPLVGKCLEVNPNIEDIYYYYGRENKVNWKNYDYSECYRMAKNNTLLIPMIYEYGPYVRSRYEALCDTFCISDPGITLEPRIYQELIPESGVVQELFGRVCHLVEKNNSRGVVFFQLTARSSNYTYPYADALIQKIVDEGYLVLTVDVNNVSDERCVFIDIRNVNINESIKLLHKISEKFHAYCIGVASCFHAISAGLGIKLLGLQHRYDESIEAVYFPSIYIISGNAYPQIPKSRQFVVSFDDYFVDSKGLFSYQPECVLKCFYKMVGTSRI